MSKQPPSQRRQLVPVIKAASHRRARKPSKPPTDLVAMMTALREEDPERFAIYLDCCRKLAALSEKREQAAKWRNGGAR